MPKSKLCRPLNGSGGRLLLIFGVIVVVKLRSAAPFLRTTPASLPFSTLRAERPWRYLKLLEMASLTWPSDTSRTFFSPVRFMTDPNFARGLATPVLCKCIKSCKLCSSCLPTSSVVGYREWRLSALIYSAPIETLLSFFLKKMFNYSNSLQMLCSEDEFVINGETKRALFLSASASSELDYFLAAAAA